MQKNLKDLTIRLKPLHIIGDEHVCVNHVTADSRQVEPGSLFVAVPGVSVDGHRYIDKAIAAGASVVALEKFPENLSEGVTYVQFADTHEALGQIASAWYGNPSDAIKLVGVTGTNGKTTIATLLYELFMSAGYMCGLLSTVCNKIGKKEVPATHTTPDAISLQALMRDMADGGCEYVFMEVSSHAADQKRIAGLQFDGGIFTNLTRDHLDYHGTVQDYLKAKKSFFDHLPATAFALTNKDDKNGPVMLQNTKARKKTYALKTVADFKASIQEHYVDSTDLLIDGNEVTIRLVGDFNVYNVLAVYGAACLLGMDRKEALLHLSLLKPVNGRFEALVSPDGNFTAVVDYAHTPDAIRNVLETIRPLVKGDGKIFCVVGAGGDRDRGKRPLMAKVACDMADRVILTSDNPRSEEPEAIIGEMKEGLSAQELKHVLCITDRKEAIRAACMSAGKNDFVLIAGKGHETYQEIKGVKHHFDDREVVRDFFDTIK